MPTWLSDVLDRSAFFMPHGHCYLWIPSLLWLHVGSDLLIGTAYLGISLLLYLLVRRIRLPFSPVFIAFGLFIGLCGLTHFMGVWTVWHPDYFTDGLLKAATAAASVATAIGLFRVRPQIVAMVQAARLSEERRVQLEAKNAELESLYNKLSLIDRQKSDFFANVSHELRTPLALILGPVELLLREPRWDLETRRKLELIRSNSKTLLRHVNELLDLAKLEAGKISIQPVELDVTSWLQGIVGQFKGVAEQRGVALEVEAESGVRAQVDPALGERILVNLLSNAFKFTPRSGEVRVSLGRRGQELEICVADTGPGIAADQHEAIFERFRQADSGTTRKYGGTGLGLAIAKDFAQLHHGSITVESALGTGSRFTVRLPLQVQDVASVDHEGLALAHSHEALEASVHDLLREHAAEPSTIEHIPTPDRATVLIVEDNAELRHFLRDVLAGQFNVIAAAEGEDGWQKALAFQPHLVVTDLMMPNMSGDQLIARLRQHKQFDAVPILLLSAKADDELRIHLLQTGAQDYLTKPFMPAELMARATNLVAMKRAGDILRQELASASSDVEQLAGELSLRHRQLQIALATAEYAKERAERATAIKSEFLGMVSHELRTPLFAMHANAQLLARHGRLPEALKEVTPRLRRAIEQMSGLIEGLLQYLRMDTGKVEPKPEATDLAVLTSEVIEAHREGVPPEVALILEQAVDTPTSLISDPNLLRVLLANLVSNALKFTAKGSVIVRVRGRGNRSVLEVQDTGVGIPKGELSRIFLPFEQLEPLKGKSTPGVGLGLAVVKQIVDILKGELDVRSEPGVGTLFTVALPADLRAALIDSEIATRA